MTDFARLQRRTFLLASVLALLAFPAGAADPIRIGSFLSVTGPASFLGDPEQKTLEMYVEKINKEGGILGRQLQLVIYDDGGDAGKANTFVKRLIDDDKVDFIIGGSTTATTMAGVQIVEEEKIPFINMAGAVIAVEPVKKWVFKTPHTDRMACEKIFEDLKKRNLLKIGLISGNAGFGKSMRDQCVGVAPKYGVQVLAEESYGAKDTDMTPQLTKIRNAPGLQAVVNADFGQGPAIVTRNYRQLGIQLPFYQSHGVASKEYIELAGPAADGVRLPAAALLVADKLPEGDKQKPVVKGYSDAYKARWKSDVSTFGGHAYDALFIAIDALKRAGSADKAKLRDAIEQTRGYIGTGGVVTMSPQDHMGLDLTAFRMLEIKGGDWTLVD
jgi:branched-chain amino acid transport system substrate-binding protein